MVTTKDNGGELIFTVTEATESPCGNTVRINEEAQAVINEIRAETGLSAAAIASRLIIFAGAHYTVERA